MFIISNFYQQYIGNVKLLIISKLILFIDFSTLYGKIQNLTFLDALNFVLTLLPQIGDLH
jgi:hypothetical protein